MRDPWCTQATAARPKTWSSWPIRPTLLAEASYAEAVYAEIVGALSCAVDVGREAAAARVGRLVLTHLMPKTSEADAIDAAAQNFKGRIDVARPGLVLEV